MPRKTKDSPPPAVVRLTQLTAPIVPSVTICNLSEADIRDLSNGVVPNWVVRTADLYLAGRESPAAMVRAMKERVEE